MPRNWKQEATGSRANAAYCEKIAAQLESQGQHRRAESYRESAAESREAAENAEYRATHGGRSY
jgi:hypothetical protein